MFFNQSSSRMLIVTLAIWRIGDLPDPKGHGKPPVEPPKADI
jgi:hypothetical protein